MSCLGERLTALVDGELDHEEREAALAHLAACAGCRAEADELRRLKGRLRGLAAAPPSDPDGDRPSPDLMARLHALGPPEPPAPPRQAPRRSRQSRPAAARPHDNRPAARTGPGGTAVLPRAVRRRAIAVGAATLVLGLGTGAYAAGGRQDQQTVSPAFQRFAVEHAVVTGDTPMTDPLTDPSTVRTAVPFSPEP
ncbi:anti-sigma factor family protein [Actinomadura parmotrematis]|uniref:Zf-HC2 domain-containing protein n=1 Tax=Actinomadura parmotrematis TaxID=2864039 RepID=A0ABS7FLV1_9ACTN|nr:zf-HC2 domain-containing protein [Actinomadura parmotrematis]MBW8481355.1 zf-HC2 domain-containing protein [Actinomadura parmotrematis]